MDNNGERSTGGVSLGYSFYSSSPSLVVNLNLSWNGLVRLKVETCFFFRGTSWKRR